MEYKYELYKKLTKRQLEIADCARRGFTDREIASALDLSVFTVKSHLKNVYEKMGVSGRTELAGLPDWHEVKVDKEPPEKYKQWKIEKELSFSPETVAYYEALLAEHVRADNLLGPHLVLNIVHHEAASLLGAVRGTRGAKRLQAVRLASRYEEFLGWLHQDAGRLDLASVHTDRARDLSTELRDPQLTAYLLMRKSNIASDLGDPALALALANAASAQTIYLPRTDRAVILRQKAHALAGLGDAHACADVIAEALEVVADMKPDDAGIASYCTIHYVAMEAAACWLQLDRPQEALSAFMATSRDWPPELHRDYGLYLARCANAHAWVGEVSTACKFAEQAIITIRQTASARIMWELQRLAERLSTWRTRPEVSAVLSAVTILNGSII
jgi:DNA-binding CsgD family transcriptional regulator